MIKTEKHSPGKKFATADSPYISSRYNRTNQLTHRPATSELPYLGNIFNSGLKHYKYANLWCSVGCSKKFR